MTIGENQLQVCPIFDVVGLSLGIKTTWVQLGNKPTQFGLGNKANCFVRTCYVHDISMLQKLKSVNLGLGFTQ